jgi:hypothetical protein
VSKCRPSLQRNEEGQGFDRLGPNGIELLYFGAITISI